jgi:ABC-type Fe3+-hydroxamate transport system substrate-binding protein
MATQNPKPNTSSSSKNPSKKGGWHLCVFFVINCLFYTTVCEAEVRIVSLSPALTEVLFELGLGKNVVGTSSFSNIPEEAKKIPTVGSYLSPSIEKIIRLNPTHVLIFKEGDPSIEESLKKANLNYLVFDSRSLDDFETLVKEIGKTFDVDKKAQEVLKVWKSQWDLLAMIPKTNKKIMIEVDHNPIFVAGADTFISKAFEKCGFKNSFDNLKGYKKIQVEAVFNRKPDVVLVLGQLNELDSFNSVKDFWKNNPVTKNATIVKGKADDLSRLSTRLPQAILKTCNEIKNL